MSISSAERIEQVLFSLLTPKSDCLLCRYFNDLMARSLTFINAILPFSFIIFYSLFSFFLFKHF